MRKVNVELILPEGVELQDIAGIIEVGCQNFVVQRRYPTHLQSEQIQLSPQLVVESPRNDSKLTLLLTERPYYEPMRRRSDEEE